MDTFYIVLTVLIGLIALPFLLVLLGLLAQIFSNLFGSEK